MNKLNLGCGYVDAPGWVNVDIKDYGHNIVADVLKGLPFPDDHFDFVLMNHTLQCFHYDELSAVLAEVMRVMKPKARLRILTPDLGRAVSHYVEGYPAFDYPISGDLEKTIGGKLFRYLFWHGDTRCGFDDDALVDLLDRNKFKFINERDYGECELDSREEESLIMEAIK